MTFAMALALGLVWGSTSVAQSSSPPLQIAGATWATKAGEMVADDVATTSLPILLQLPEMFEIGDADRLIEIMLQACQQIMLRPADFAADGQVPEPFDFVHLNIVQDEQRVYPYWLGIRIVDGACSGTISFVMPTLETPFSNHGPDHEFFAVLHTWGLGQPEIYFETGTSGKVLRVEIERLVGFGRELGTINALALCIHALANVESTFRRLGVPIRAENYPVINIEVVERQSALIASTTSILAQVGFNLKQGQCEE